MVSDRFTLIAALLRYTGQIIIPAQFCSADEVLLMVEAGLLIPSGVPAAVPCETCDETHRSDVIALDGRPHGFCIRTGMTFLIDRSSEMFTVDAAAVARLLASALRVDGSVQRVQGFSSLWSLGARRLSEHRVTFYFIPDLDRIDLSNSIIAAVSRRSGALQSALLVASGDMLDHVRLLNKRLAVVRISNVAQFSGNRSFIIDEILLTANIFPDEPSKYGRSGAPPVQRNRILKVLHEMAATGVTIETSNIGLDAIAKRVAGEDKPSRSTVRDAVRRWESQSTG